MRLPAGRQSKDKKEHGVLVCVGGRKGEREEERGGSLSHILQERDRERTRRSCERQSE
jgi:hypothetical protein